MQCAESLRLSPIELAPLAWLKLTQDDRPDRDADQTQRRMAHRRGHAADLTVLTLAQGDLEPGRRDGLAQPDGDRPRRESGRLRQPFDLCRTRASAAEENAAAKARQSCFIRRPLDLDQIDFRKLVPRVRDAMRQRAVGGQKQETLCIMVQPPCRIDIWNRNEARQRRPSPRIRKARQHAVRFEKYQRAGGGHGTKGFDGAVIRITRIYSAHSTRAKPANHQERSRRTCTSTAGSLRRSG